MGEFIYYTARGNVPPCLQISGNGPKIGADSCLSIFYICFSFFFWEFSNLLNCLRMEGFGCDRFSQVGIAKEEK